MKIIVEGRRKNSRMGNRTRRKRRTLSSTEQLSHECALRYELAIIISYTTMAKANQSSRIAFSMIQFLIIICTQIGRFHLNTFILSCAFQNKNLTLLVIPGLPHFLTLINISNKGFTNKLMLRFVCHFAVCSGKF